MLIRHALMILLELDRGHHRGVAVAPAHRADAGLAPDERAASIGANHQRRAQHPPASQRHARLAGRDLHARHALGRKHRQFRPDRRLRQSRPDVPVLQHVAQRLALRAIGDLGGVEAQERRHRRSHAASWRASVCDQDLLDTLCVRFQKRRRAQRAPLPERRE